MPSELHALFITGASGLVGRRVVRALMKAGAKDVRLLVRDPSAFERAVKVPATWRLVRGSLEDVASWSSALDGAHTVLHMASSSGKVTREVHERVIVEGTSQLLTAALRARVPRFLYVSSVAAGFADTSHYHYANAKRAAEARVRESGMDALIVRPTMVFGDGSPVLEGLQRLARLPLPIVFGPGSALLQPIHVDDLSQLLVAALDPSLSWNGETVTLGGADTMRTDALLARLRANAGSSEVDAPVRFIPIPVDSLRALLALVEPMLLSVLPFSAGQLTSFVNASDAGPTTPLRVRLLARLPTPLRGIDAMLGESANAGHAR